MLTNLSILLTFVNFQIRNVWNSKIVLFKILILIPKNFKYIYDTLLNSNFWNYDSFKKFQYFNFANFRNWLILEIFGILKFGMLTNLSIFLTFVNFQIREVWNSKILLF